MTFDIDSRMDQWTKANAAQNTDQISSILKGEKEDVQTTLDNYAPDYNDEGHKRFRDMADLASKWGIVFNKEYPVGDPERISQKLEEMGWELQRDIARKRRGW